MVMIAYRLLCLCMAGVGVWTLAGPATRQQKVTVAVVLVPLVLRALLIK
jgi:hypothetical protein